MGSKEFRIIQLFGKKGEGKFAKVSPDRLDQLSQYRWVLSSWGYVVRFIGSARKETRTVVSMHRQIIQPAEGMLVDHIDGDRLNNCDWNLREATSSQNNSNRHVSVAASYAKYQGVIRDPRSGKWRASIGVNHKVIHLGIYDSEDYAARVRDGAAIYYHGEFATMWAPDLDPIPYEPKPLGPSATKTSKYIGVGWHKSKNCWRAYHYKDGKSIHIGGFKDELEAAIARDHYVVSQGFTDAVLNFPEQPFLSVPSLAERKPYDGTRIFYTYL
jgi:hypothetical protein